MKKMLYLTSLIVSVAVSISARDVPAPLFDGMGHHHHPITTASKEAQRYFDQGLALLYGFNHFEAIRSFEAVTRLDPGSAMAYWGIAYAYGPNINKPMGDEDVPKAWKALQKAIELQSKAGPKERAYINALAQRYRPEPVEDRSELDLAFADAMRDVAREYPDDHDAATLFAEALMNTMPWEYWTKEQTPKPATGEVLTALREVLQRNPDHPGANHFYIHAVEAGPNPELGLPSADRLGSIAPKAGHLVHMPAHIYIRVGQYHDASKVNEVASKVDRDYIAQCRAQGFYPGVYYPHNVHFLWFATSIEGRSKDCLKAAQTVAEYALDARCSPTQVLEAPRFRHLPQLTHLRFGRWDEVLNAPAPAATNDFLFDRAMWHYCRGVAFLKKGNAAEASRESEALSKIAGSAEAQSLDSPIFPASGILQVARNIVAGRLAGARGDNEQMIQRLEKAVAAQDELPYMEPPFWYYPVRQTLAAAWLEAGDPVKAEQIFRESLKEAPRHPWSLFGLEQSLKRQGNTTAAASVHREFQRSWKHADVELELSMF
jgi:tetratricopeptide (TPR) repeat protein